MKPRLLDLFCGAGGAAMGYATAGFEVVGVDRVEQPQYPFARVTADALRFLDEVALVRRSFDVIHASPPCQRHSALGNTNRALGRAYEHPDLIAEVRARLLEIGLPYVIENVVGAPLMNPIRLCGTSFGLPLRRHRLFESSVPLTPVPCEHGRFTEPKYWTGWTQHGRTAGNKRLSTVVQVYGHGGNKHEWGPAMGIDWMTPKALAQAIPPAYTHYIGRQVLLAMERVA